MYSTLLQLSVRSRVGDMRDLKKLKRVFGHQRLADQRHDSSPIGAVHSNPQLGPPLLGVHGSYSAPAR